MCVFYWNSRDLFESEDGISASLVPSQAGGFVCEISCFPPRPALISSPYPLSGLSIPSLSCPLVFVMKGREPEDALLGLSRYPSLLFSLHNAVNSPIGWFWDVLFAVGFEHLFQGLGSRVKATSAFLRGRIDLPVPFRDLQSLGRWEDLSSQRCHNTLEFEISVSSSLGRRSRLRWGNFWSSVHQKTHQPAGISDLLCFL